MFVADIASCISGVADQIVTTAPLANVVRAATSVRTQHRAALNRGAQEFNRHIHAAAMASFGKAPTVDGQVFDYYTAVTKYVTYQGSKFNASPADQADIVQTAMVMLLEHASNMQASSSNIFERQDPTKPFTPLLNSFVKNFLRQHNRKHFQKFRREGPLEVGGNDGETFSLLDKLPFDPGSFESGQGQALYQSFLAALRNAIAKDRPDLVFIFDELYLKNRERRDIAKDFFPRKYKADATSLNAMYNVMVPDVDFHSEFINTAARHFISDAKGSSEDRAQVLLMVLGELKQLERIVGEAANMIRAMSARDQTVDVTDRTVTRQAVDYVVEEARKLTKRAPKKGAMPKDLITYVNELKEPFSPGKVNYQAEQMRRIIEEVIDESRSGSGDPGVLKAMHNIQTHNTARGMA